MEYSEQELLSISQFSKMTGITRPNLIFYDKENLLKPVVRKDTNYRMYHFSQIVIAYQIVVYRMVGLSLPQIRELLNDGSIEETRHMLKSHITTIDQQIKALEQQKYNMLVYEASLQKYGNRENEDRFVVEETAEEAISLSPSFRKSNTNIQTMIDFLIYCRSNEMQIDCHIGRMFTPTVFNQNDWITPEYVFFRKIHGSHKKAKGVYLIYTTYSDGSDINEIYHKFFQYIKEHDYQITGNIYEDYPLSGILASDRKKHMIRISIKLRVEHPKIKND